MGLVGGMIYGFGVDLITPEVLDCVVVAVVLGRAVAAQFLLLYEQKKTSFY